MNPAIESLVGQERSLVLVEDLRRTQIVQYAGASGDFNPLHTDEVYAVHVGGRTTVIAHGMLTMAMTARIVTDWFGEDSVRSIGVRFAQPVGPGATLTAHAVVQGISAAADRLVAEIRLRTVNQDGKVVLTGTALVVIPEGLAAGTTSSDRKAER